MKTKWTKHCLLGVDGVDNKNANSNDFIFTIRNTKLYISVIISRKNQALSKDQCIGMNIKQKVGIKIWNRSIYILFNQYLQALTDCLFWFIQMLIIMQKHNFQR